MKFTDKWMELENILSEVIQSQKNTHGMYLMTSTIHCQVDISPKAQKNQDTIHRPYEGQEEGRKKCGQSVQQRLRKGHPETASSGHTSHIQLPNCMLLEIACWQQPDIAVSWEALSESDKYRGECSQLLDWTRGPWWRSWRRDCRIWGHLQSCGVSNCVNLSDYPGAPKDWTTYQRIQMERPMTLATYVGEDVLVGHHGEEWPSVLWGFDAPV